MDSDRWRQVSRLYEAALARPEDDRIPFLDDACGGDKALRDEVASMLAFGNVRSSFLQPPIAELVQQLARTPLTLEGRRLGPYVIGPLIGAGGMGEVYRGRDTKLGREVAIKILPPFGATSADRRARFDREARLLASLNHPHIGAIYGAEEAEGICALVLELVEGQTLAERLAGGPPSIDEALSIAAQIAEALEAAHERGIVHRDLKPGNIKITPEGTVKVLDFGLAKVVAPQTEGSPPVTKTDAHTGEGAVLGTFRYMSPEQARGKPTDKRTDIWAFGCVLYELLTGRAAFGGDTPFDTVAAILEREPDWKALPDGTPQAIRQVLRRCLEKDPRQRLRDIGEARIELERLHRRSVNIPYWAVVSTAGVLAATAAAIWFVAAPERDDARFQGTPRQLTFAPGMEAEPALSPDGSLVAYTSDEAGNADIWIVDARGGQPLRLTTDEASDRRPAWFPDGSAIAFVSSRGGAESIWKLPRLGGSATLLVADASDPAVSPDGSQIAFSQPGPSTLRRIAVAPIADTSRARFLTGDGDGLWHHVSPTWSADGETICYAAQDALWLVRAGGGKPWRLTTDHQFDREPVWSTDGRYVYFASSREGTTALWRVGANGGDPMRLTIGTGPERRPSVSLGGDRLAYSTLAANSEVVLIDLASGQEHRIPGVRNEASPTFVPDGRAVVFYSNRWGGRYDLWLQPLMGAAPHGDPRRLTDHSGSANYPTYSPDGEWLAYGRVVGERRDIWVISASGGVPNRLTDGPGAHFHPSWSPTGSRIAFVSEEQNVYRIQQAEVAHGRLVGIPATVATLNSMPVSPVWSPDGSELAYVIDGNDVWLVNASGLQPPRQITVGAGAQRVRWNRGTGRLFASGFWGTDRMTVRIVDLKTGTAAPPRTPMVLGETSGFALSPLSGDFDISTDETLAALNRGDLNGDIWVLDNKPRSY